MWPAIGGLIAFATIAALAWEVVVRVLKRRRLRGRDILPDDQIVTMFATKGLRSEEIQTFLAEISKATTIPVGLLRPDDRFNTELSPVRGLTYDDGVFLLPEGLEYRFGLARGAIQLENAGTLRALLERIVETREGQNRLI